MTASSDRPDAATQVSPEPQQGEEADETAVERPSAAEGPTPNGSSAEQQPAAEQEQQPAAEQDPPAAEEVDAGAAQGGQPQADQPPADATAPAEQAVEPAQPEAGGKAAKEAKPKPRKRSHPPVEEVVKRIGTTTEDALAYVGEPDAKLSRIGRKGREALIPELPATTAAALLGPAALARHLVASAAIGRYRDLFALWGLFRQFPDECKPVLAERGKALERARRMLRAATLIGLAGREERVAEDIRRAEGLIWQWLRDTLLETLPAVGARPAVAAALLEREPDLEIPLPDSPTQTWLAEAARVRTRSPLPNAMEKQLAANVHQLPATADTLRLAAVHYPDRVPALVDRVDLDSPDIGVFMAWARDHGAADRLMQRIRERVAGAAARNRAEGLALWYQWTQRGVHLDLPEQLRGDSLDGLDLTRPETAELAARLIARGAQLDVQSDLKEMATQNRHGAEKAYEALVCAGLDVELPSELEDNPIVKDGTRCPNCRAWTWVRPGHEERCPRPPAPQPEPDPFELAAAEFRGQQAE